MAKGFYSLDTITGACPHCGSELVFVEYYSAVENGSAVAAGQSGRKDIKTMFSDVRKGEGAFCMACLYKELALLLTISRAMVILGFLGTAAFGILMVLKGNAVLFFPMLVCLWILGLGWHGLGDDGLIGENPYTGLTAEQIHKTATYPNQHMQDALSYQFVVNFPKDERPKGRTLLPRNVFRD